MLMLVMDAVLDHDGANADDDDTDDTVHVHIVAAAHQ
jgi:hypothetical protein